MSAPAAGRDGVGPAEMVGRLEATTSTVDGRTLLSKLNKGQLLAVAAAAGIPSASRSMKSQELIDAIVYMTISGPRGFDRHLQD